ncbi:3-isopropylmalate dehydratase small subunit [Henriciella sp. AS95]|uniref:3-isopropylmalate dehydratase small subunit n=1 Tax=Henriciella sp. AS95 TaxID=3135782 RepID=UPI00317E2E84
MNGFSTLSSRAAWLDEDDIDTDAIYPARFLMVLERSGLEEHLFKDRRFRPDGTPDPDFIFNQPDYEDASILVAGRNFGSGSSREHAVWALRGHGIRCVIAQGFSEIFYANCIRNGVLPIIATDEQAEAALQDAKALETFCINLETREVSSASATWTFDIDDMDQQALQNGWDDSERILNLHRPDIERFETSHRASQPWLFLDETTS